MGEEKHIDLNIFEKLEKIGEGAFGKVFKITNKKTRKIYAAKISFKEIIMGNQEETIDIQREINIMSKIDHPTILKFIGYSAKNFKDQFKPVIITEYSKNGSLHNIINQEKRLVSLKRWDSTKKLKCIYGIACGMSYLHSHKILHRDLKSLNILMSDEMEPKIADFGFSKILHNNSSSISFQSTHIIKGTPNYLAPEIWTECLYTEFSDVYSYGMIIYEIYTQKVPFEKVLDIEIMQKVKNGDRPNISVPIPEAYKELIEKCWSQDMNKRPPFSQIASEIRNDRRFITSDVNEEEFRNYVKYIDDYHSTFHSENQIIHQIGSENNSEENTLNSIQPSRSFFSKILSKSQMKINNINLTDPNCQQLIKEAEKNPVKKFVVGKYFIEGKCNFPVNFQIGIKYLESSISDGYIESVIYYCSMLIKKNMPVEDIKKAQKYLSKHLNSNDSRIFYLYGKLLKKQKEYIKASKYLEKAAKSGNSDSLFEYGKMLLTGKAVEQNSELGMKYIRLAAVHYKNKKADDFLYDYQTFQYIETFDNFPPETQCFLVSQVCRSNYHDDLIVKYDKLQMLYENHSLESIWFESLFRPFVSISFDIKYPYKKFEEVFSILKRLENRYPKLIKVRLIIEDTKNLSYIFGENYAVHEIIINPPTKCINDAAFRLFRSLENVTFPETLKTIGEYAFSGCLNLKEIELPVSVKEIKETSFYNCKSLTKFTASKKIIDQLNYYAKVLKISTNIPNHIENSFLYNKLAADQGNTDSMTNYAIMLCEGLCTPVNYEDSIRYFKMAADKGDDKAMLNYAKMLMDGTGCEINNEEAFYYLKMAAEKGNSNGMVILGKLLSEGIGCDKNIEEACRYYKMAADKGNSNGMVIFGRMLNKGLGISINHEQACKFFKKAADEGNVDGMINYGIVLKDGIGIDINNEEACKYFELAANKGNANGFFCLGHMYLKGLGVSVNYKEALQYFKKAADKGHLKGMNSYGYMLNNGIGTPIDRKKAEKYFKKAADGGDSLAMVNYGQFLLKSNDPDKFEKACNYFKSSSDKNNMNGMIHYSFMLDNGLGTCADHQKADELINFIIAHEKYKIIYKFSVFLEKTIEIPNNQSKIFLYLKIAADSGFAEAQFKLGILYYEGKYVEQSIKKSIYYLNLSSDQNNSKAQFFLGKIYFEGKFVNRDLNKSIHYFNISAEKSNVSKDLEQSIHDSIRIKIIFDDDEINVIGDNKEIITFVQMKSIEDSFFEGFSSLTNIEIPPTVTEIGNKTFKGCSSLTKIIIPESISIIGYECFSRCSSLKLIELPSSITEIKESTFEDCISLTEILIPEKVTEIGDKTFKGCSSLTKIIIPETVLTIGYECFSRCSSLKQIELPSSITEIKENTFECCTLLNEIKLPSNILSIGDNSFNGCSSLPTIDIPLCLT